MGFVVGLSDSAMGLQSFGLLNYGNFSLALVDFKSRFRFEAESNVLERTVARRTVRNKL